MFLIHPVEAYLSSGLRCVNRCTRRARACVCARAMDPSHRCLNRPTAISHLDEINNHLSLPISNKIHKHGHSRTSDNGKCGGRIAFLRNRASACHHPFDIACARPFFDSKSFLMRFAAINSMNIANKTKWRLMQTTRQEIAKNCIKQQRPLSLSYHKILSLSPSDGRPARSKKCACGPMRCNCVATTAILKYFQRRHFDGISVIAFINTHTRTLACGADATRTHTGARAGKGKNEGRWHSLSRYDWRRDGAREYELVFPQGKLSSGTKISYFY